MSAFAMAVVTNRAFQLTFSDLGGTGRFGLADFLKVFEPNEIDWSWYEKNKASVPADTFDKLNYFREHGSPGMKEVEDFYSTKQFSFVSSGKNIFVTQNTGALHRILQNPNYHNKFAQAGLTIDTAFRTFWNFLLKPSAEVENFNRQHFASLDTGDAVKIGIHVRFGDGGTDGKFGGEFHDPQRGFDAVTRQWDAFFQPFFDAAEQVTALAQAGRPNRKVLWLCCRTCLQFARLRRLVGPTVWSLEKAGWTMSAPLLMELRASRPHLVS